MKLSFRVKNKKWPNITKWPNAFFHGRSAVEKRPNVSKLAMKWPIWQPWDQLKVLHL